MEKSDLIDFAKGNCDITYDEILQDLKKRCSRWKSYALSEKERSNTQENLKIYEG